MVTRLFSDRLRRLRQEKKLSQEVLANILNISKGALNNYEKGRRVPDIDTLNCIADYFNVSSDYLLGRTDVEKVDADLQAVCKYTDLSEHTLNRILELKTFGEICGRQRINDERIEERANIFEFLVCETEILECICSMLEKSAEYYNKKLNENPEFGLEHILDDEMRYIRWKFSEDIIEEVEYSLTDFVLGIKNGR